ncbi:hypothetical protein ACFQI7_14380 [Paenibacillus allorhizosphaerae]|uniref:DUF1657 domain-containing protein n=1 Tax=Paenibacillus allorhizosphaerae TaxID=2849866 RepID=A0ABN7THL9_9BACL|nr:hypothetical protein [Paenibacillus allorhizosphaerae]CAG7626494.1 hypothetical protein PAECIP111802_01256 [Paenibacillus allorhizosphaerae]
MEKYQTLIGVVLEKLDQTYKDLTFNYHGLDGVLQTHTEEERQNTPELLTINELRQVYDELIRCLEHRLPGIKD